MIHPKCVTNLEVKEQNIDAFLNYIKDQIVYGGQKYKASEAREATDIITEVCGVDWTIGTMIKYLLRFRNTQREKDLFKLGAYAFIIWLQMGFHEQKKHETDTWNEGGKK